MAFPFLFQSLAFVGRKALAIIGTDERLMVAAASISESCKQKTGYRMLSEKAHQAS
nr:hypothetical protein [uncultured Cohaesibacter sp.]